MVALNLDEERGRIEALREMAAWLAEKIAEAGARIEAARTGQPTTTEAARAE